MEVSGQFQALTTLPWRKSCTIPIELEGWVVHWVGLDRMESNYKLYCYKDRQCYGWGF